MMANSFDDSDDEVYSKIADNGNGDAADSDEELCSNDGENDNGENDNGENDNGENDNGEETNRFTENGSSDDDGEETNRFTENGSSDDDGREISLASSNSSVAVRYRCGPVDQTISPVLRIDPNDFKKVADIRERLDLWCMTVEPTRFRYIDRERRIDVPCCDYADYVNVYRTVVRNDIGYLIRTGSRVGSGLHSDLTRRQNPVESLLRALDCQHQRGGSVKNWLQSNKSYLYYLVTYPLTNSLRMYVLPGPQLPLYSCALPLHAVCKFFDFHHLDFDVFTVAVPVRFFHVIEAENLYDRFIDTDSLRAGGRFSILDRRDPVLHDGSVHYYRYVFIMRPDDRNGLVSDAKKVNTMDALNKNEDYDGDQTGDKIARGLECSYEIPFYMHDETMALLRSRHIFTQNVCSRVFVALSGCIDSMRDHLSDVDAYVKRMVWNLNVRDNPVADLRAKRFFDFASSFSDESFSDYGKNALEDSLLFYNLYTRMITTNILSSKRPVDVWAPLTCHANLNCRSILDSLVHTASVTFGVLRIDNFVNIIIQRAHEWCPELYLGRSPFCVASLVAVMSRSKGSLDSLRDLGRRCDEAVATCDSLNRDDELREVAAEKRDLLTRVPVDKLDANCRYLDNFVSISKDVPKNCKLSVGIKWTVQDLLYENGNMINCEGDVVIEDVLRFVPPSFLTDEFAALAILDALMDHDVE